MLEIFSLFYQGLLPVFLTFNRYFQREVPLIYQLPEAQERFMNKWAARFIKPEVIQEIKNEEKSFAKSNKRHRSWNSHSHQVKSKTTSWKRRYFSRSFWQILWWSQSVFFISLPILCKLVTTGGFPSSKLQFCWFWSEKQFFVWLRSTYSWIFWYHKLAINRTSRVIRHVRRRIYGVASHDSRWCTTAHLGWSFC